MQFFTTLAITLSLVSSVLAVPQPTKVVAKPYNYKPTKKCTTTYTVTTSYPPRGVRYTTTVYTEMVAVPRDVPCNGCSLKVVTKTINKSRKPDATATATTAGFLQPPICFDFPTAA
ncbi:hypothetical protein TWF481_004950 [Arthrobotrys musiformis]|uniref:Uncharacterized protein n=1 Tax=Arthrobotrys musiformis TaxID=47236 RepID=A0AAV9WN24_9PEZI